MRLFLLFTLLLLAQTLWADIDVPLLRRLSVFPIKVSEVDNKLADDTWWKVRELLSKDRRFLIASKRFMQNREVLQPRTNLKPADVVILGRVLDAEALMVIYTEGRELFMVVYESENGALLWKNSIKFHPSLSIAEQLMGATEKLTRDFLTSIPYQGYVVIDPLRGKAVYEEKQMRLVVSEVGSGITLQEGDAVHFIRTSGNLSSPMWMEGAKVEVIAEGRVFKLEGSQAQIEVLRTKEQATIVDTTLVRFPSELKKLEMELGSDLANNELLRINHNSHQAGSLPMALAFIGNLALFMLLAF